MARKTFTTRIEADLIRKLKYLSADTDRNMNDLLEEAIKKMEDSGDIVEMSKIAKELGVNFHLPKEGEGKNEG